jgi:hypothetical protein
VERYPNISDHGLIGDLQNLSLIDAALMLDQQLDQQLDRGEGLREPSPAMAR